MPTDFLSKTFHSLFEVSIPVVLLFWLNYLGTLAEKPCIGRRLSKAHRPLGTLDLLPTNHLVFQEPYTQM